MPSPPIERVQIRNHRYQRRRGNTEAREAGLRFEARVQEWFVGNFSDFHYHPEPHVMYWTARGPRNAFPDGYLDLPKRVVLFEIKRQHMPEAWWQLRKHYQLVFESYTNRPVQVCEIVKEFDLSMPFPESDVHCFELSGLPAFLERDPKQFGVLVWPKQ